MSPWVDSTALRWAIKTLEGKGFVARQLDTLRKALKPKRGVQGGRIRQELREELARAEWNIIKDKVRARSGGVCEIPACQHPTTDTAPDHFVSGSGKRTTHQSVYTVWDLCSWHHEQRQLNKPNAFWWASEFELHCARQSNRAREMGNDAADREYTLAAEFARKRISLSEYRAQTRTGLVR